MKLQYKHTGEGHYHGARFYRRTYVIEQPTRDVLEALEAQLKLGEATTMTVVFGEAKLHPIEKQWVKKIGRDVALKNAKATVLKFESIQHHKGFSYYFFYTGESNRLDVNRVTYRFLLSTGREEAYLNYISGE